MISRNPFLKYIMKDTERSDVFHSSAYGRAQNAGGMGAASGESFAMRRAMEANRKLVRGYGDAGVMNAARMQGPKAKKYTPPAKNGA